MTGKAERAQNASPLFDWSALHFFLGYYRPRLTRLVAFTLGAAAQSLLVLPVLALIRYAFDSAIPAGNVNALMMIGLAIILLRAAGSAMSLMLRAHVLHTIKGTVTELRRDLVSRVYRLSQGYFANADLAVLHTRIVQDSERVDQLSNTLISAVVPAAVASVVLFAVLCVLNWTLVLVGALVFPLMWLTTRRSGWFVKGHVVTFQRAFEGFSKGVQFTVRQLDLTRAKGFEVQELERQQGHIGELYATGHRMAMSYAIHSQVQRTLTGIAGMVVLVVGGAAVARGSMTLGEFITFYLAAGMFYGYVDTLTSSIPEMLAGNASLVTLHRFMTDGEAEPYRGARHVAFDGSVELRGVSFSYSVEPLLRHIDLSIAPHAQVAIVGANGAGKSTIVQLLMGFYRPQHGQVLVAGIPFDEIDIRELRRSIGIVPQRPQFFAGTVRENVAYGAPNATQGEIDDATRLALADEVIAGLPNGYDTPIGEQGVRLSGGEAQRLAIARALLGNPRLLILDEPTNHLDAPTIARVMRGLASQRERPSLLIISHDPTVVDHADRIYRLHDGVLTLQQRAMADATTS